MQIQGQAALVTGGASGLGEATARELARLGAKVAVLDRNAELQLSLDRKDYEPGQEISVSIRAPYVGAGLNYTRFSSVNLPAGVSIDRNSFGPALQVGVDIPLAKNLYLNFDVKKVFIKTDVSAGGAKLGTFKVDPVLVGVGLGWRF